MNRRTKQLVFFLLDLTVQKLNLLIETSIEP